MNHIITLRNYLGLLICDICLKNKCFKSISKYLVKIWQYLTIILLYVYLLPMYTFLCLHTYVYLPSIYLPTFVYLPSFTNLCQPTIICLPTSTHPYMWITSDQGAAISLVYFFNIYQHITLSIYHSTYPSITVAFYFKSDLSVLA